MASFNKIIQFDVNEIERCSQVKNGLMSWISERQLVADKFAYTEYLFPKLIQAVNGRSSFSMAEKPKTSGKSNGVLYVYCDHLKPLKIRQGVFYELKEHGFNKPLVLTFKQKCLDCEGLNSQQPQMIPEVVPHHVPNDLPPEQVNLEVSSDFVSAIESIDVKLIEFVEQVKRECLLHPNPLQFLISKAGFYGLMANKAVIEAIINLQGISFNIDNSGTTSAANSGDLGNVTTVPPLSASTVSTATATTSTSTTVTQVHVTPITSAHLFITPVSPTIITPVTPSTPALTTTLSTRTPLIPSSTEITPVTTTTATQLNTSKTPTFVSRTLRSAERVATEAAQNASGDGAVGTPALKGVKRSGRALLAQKKQEGNIQKKSRGI